MFEHLVPSGGAVWVGLGERWPCWRKYVTVGGGFEVAKVILALCPWSSSCESRASYCFATPSWTLTLWNHKPNKPFLLLVALVMVLYHSNRNVTNTRWLTYLRKVFKIFSLILENFKPCILIIFISNSFLDSSQICSHFLPWQSHIFFLFLVTHQFICAVPTDQKWSKASHLGDRA